MDGLEIFLIVSVLLPIFGVAMIIMAYEKARKERIEAGEKGIGEILCEVLGESVDHLDKRHQDKQKRKAEFQTAWSCIRPGLSEEEVLKHLGPPDDVIPVEPVVWSYRSGKLTGFVMFQDGFVVGYKKPEKTKHGRFA